MSHSFLSSYVFQLFLRLDDGNCWKFWEFLGVLRNARQALVVQRADNSIHRMNHYTVISVLCVVIYPADSVIHPLNKQAQAFRRAGAISNTR